MKCDLAAIGERDGRLLYQCRRCGKELRSHKTDPTKIKMTCGVPAAPKRGPCIHAGAEVRREQCQTCSGNVLVKIMACKVFGECSIAKPMPGVACCLGCPQWATESPAPA